jgi:predicted GTPase
MYNFNPGAEDVATGTPDAVNGRFEVTGLAFEFMNRSSLKRKLSFSTQIEPIKVRTTIRDLAAERYR